MWRVAFPLDTTRGRWPIHASAYIENFGTYTEWNTPVRCWIDSAGVRLYDGAAVHAPPLHPMRQAMVNGFPWWDFTPGNYLCDVTMFTELETDENRSNDTLYTTTYMQLAPLRDWLCFERIYGVYVDGCIDQYEWDFWRGADISDVNGRGGTVWPLGTAALYSAHADGNDFALLALDVIPARWQTPGMWDSVFIMLDEDRDSLWSADSSEGYYVLYVDGVWDSLAFYAMPERVPIACPRAHAMSSTYAGNVQIEAAIPIGQEKSSIDVVPWNDVSGVAISCWRHDTCLGWWPQTLEKEHWEDPAHYGQVYWLAMGRGEDGSIRAVPSLPRGSVVHRADWLRSQGHGVLLDLAGRRVLDLQPGENDIRHIVPGVYFLRSAESGTRSAITRKVVIQR